MKPLTRKEMLLDGAAKGNLDDFKPATREEVFAKRTLANAGGSGGTSSFVVNFNITPGKLFIDCTYDDIIEALDVGKEVLVKMGYSTLCYGGIRNDTITGKDWLFFSSCYVMCAPEDGDEARLQMDTVAISNDNEVKYFSHKTEVTLDFSM